MKKLPWKSTLIVLVSIWIVSQIAFGLSRNIDDRAVERAAKDWAARVSAPDVNVRNPDSAKEWLHRHEFEYILEGKQYGGAHRDEEIFLVVTGSRRLRESSWLHREAWLDVDFLFDANRKSFIAVETRIWRFQPYSES